MLRAEQFFESGISFHGHKCPAMPLGLRAAVAAMNTLGVQRSKDKELFVISETGNDHAAACFLDGIMVATGCTYGKSNIKKLYYNKMAFTLIDVKRQKAVRASLKPEFFAKMIQSPFVKKRKEGILPQDIEAEIADPLIKNIMSIPEEAFLNLDIIESYKFSPKKGCFDIDICFSCGEMAFVNKLVDSTEGKICLHCDNKEEE